MKQERNHIYSRKRGKQMNKYEKALINIADRLEDNYSPCSSFLYSDDYKNISQLVERATPKKVIIKIDDNRCSICNTYIPYHKNEVLKSKFCRYCGQALEWKANER